VVCDEEGGEMLEEYKREFREQGAVDVHVSRRTGGFGMVAGGLAFAAGAAFLMVSQGASIVPVGAQRAVGVLSGLFAAVVLAYGVRMLVRPMFLARVEPAGLTTWRAPRASWDEVLGASAEATSGVTFTRVRLSPGYWERLERDDPARVAKLRRHADAGEDEVVIPVGAPGGAETMVRLILWAKATVESPG
jgi:hypothetical protein